MGFISAFKMLNLMFVYYIEIRTINKLLHPGILESEISSNPQKLEISANVENV